MDVLEALAMHIPLDDGSEFIANAAQELLAKIGVRTLCIKTGRPWENGYCGSFNCSMPDELLDGNIIYALAEATILIEVSRPHQKL